MSVPYPTPASPLFQLAIDFLDRGSKQDFANPESILAPDFTFRLWPSTLRYPGESQRLRFDAFMDRMKGLLEGFIDTFGMDLEHPVNVVEGKDCIVLQLLATTKLKASGKPYEHDCVYIIRFDDHQKVVSLDEFQDSAAVMGAYKGSVRPRFDATGRVANVDEAKRAEA